MGMFEQRERNQLQNLKLPIFMQIYSMLKDHDDASVSGRGTISSPKPQMLIKLCVR